MKLYESDHTKFMRELFEKNPQLPEDQKKARAIWWDKKLDPEERKRFKESACHRKPTSISESNSATNRRPEVCRGLPCRMRQQRQMR